MLGDTNRPELQGRFKVDQKKVRKANCHYIAAKASDIISMNGSIAALSLATTAR
jgi:hypothetical protein